MKTFFADLYYIIFSGLDAPENTLKAAKQAKVNGAKCVHFDLNFTYDGVAVVSARSWFRYLNGFTLLPFIKWHLDGNM